MTDPMKTASERLDELLGPGDGDQVVNVQMTGNHPMIVTDRPIGFITKRYVRRNEETQAFEQSDDKITWEEIKLTLVTDFQSYGQVATIEVKP